MPRRPKRIPTPPVPDAFLLKLGARSLQPDVWRVGEGRDARVWKTFRESPAPWRLSICTWLAEREARNLALLEGVVGVPQLLSQPEPWTLEMSWLPARPAPDHKGTLSPAYFDALADLLLRIHLRGLNHGDLRRKNLLVDEQERPYVIDFAQSMELPGPLRRLAQRADWFKFVRLKLWYLGPEALSAEENARLEAGVPFHSTAHFLRKKVYRPYKHWRQGGRRPSEPHSGPPSGA